MYELHAIVKDLKIGERAGLLMKITQGSGYNSFQFPC